MERTEESVQSNGSYSWTCMTSQCLLMTCFSLITQRFRNTTAVAWLYSLTLCDRLPSSDQTFSVWQAGWEQEGTQLFVIHKFCLNNSWSLHGCNILSRITDLSVTYKTEETLVYISTWIHLQPIIFSLHVALLSIWRIWYIQFFMF